MERDAQRAPGRVDAALAPTVPMGREARLWRVVVELFATVDEAVAREAARAADRVEPARPRPLAAGRLEHLVVEFDDAYTVYVEGMDRLPSEAQLIALQAVDRHLAAMVRAQDAALWTATALSADPRWAEVLRLARAVVSAFDWPERRLAVVGSGGRG